MSNEQQFRRRMNNPRGEQLDLDFDVFFVGYYQGQGRGGDVGDKTRLLLNSKYNGDVEARTQIMDDLLDTIRREIPGGATRTDYICYAAANGSGIEHARFLAAMLADNIGADLCAPSRVATIPAGSRVLL